jgi:hypothetical protein
MFYTHPCFFENKFADSTFVHWSWSGNIVVTNLISFLTASIAWRMMFVLFLVFQDLVFHTVSGQLQSIEAGMTFF